MALSAALNMDERGSTSARYEILGKLGQGATGSVFQAYDHALLRIIALKVLHPDADKVAALSFDRERKALSRMQHDNVVTLFDSRPRAPQPFMALAYHQGPSLKSVLAHGLLTERQAAAIAYEVSRALEHIHGLGFVYRDVKPENLILDGERVVLIDFGTAVELGSEHLNDEVAGTLGFMAPEQYDGRHVDLRCDVFGLGALLYEAVVGTTPYAVFAKRRRMIRPHRYTHPSAANSELSEAFASVIHRCLALEPAQRFSSCHEVRAAVAECLASLAVVDPRCVIYDLVDTCP